MRPYLCISHAPEYAAAAGRLIRELTRYGFFSLCADADANRSARGRLASESRTVLLLCGDDLCAPCLSDLALAQAAGVPVVCVTADAGAADDCAAAFVCAENGVPFIRMPDDTSNGPSDDRARAAYMDALYIRHLCSATVCFSPVRCVDDTYGRLMRKAAEAYAGSRDAQWALGQVYEHGKGIPASAEAAAFWTEKAAAQGQLDALIRLGEYKLDGEGLPRDPDGARALFERAAAAGDVRGVYHCGLCCLYGYGQPRDPESAARYLRQAADTGYRPAQYRLALLCRDGVGTPMNGRAAMELLYIACAEITGYRKKDTRIGAAPPPDPWTVVPLMDRRPVACRRKPLAYHCITMRQMREQTLNRRLFPKLCEQGEGWVETVLLEKAARSMQRIVRIARVSSPEEAWLRLPPEPSRDAGRINKTQSYGHQVWDASLAAAALGRLLERGCPADGLRPAPTQALRWYRRAAARGHSGAMFRLGDCYRRGVGVPRDRVKAFELYLRAALLGSERGQFALGVCYEYGEGVPQNPVEAAHWYEMAAHGGYAPAQNNLGGCFEYGVGVAPDMAAAVACYTRAAEAGQPEAACRLGLCYELGKGVTRDMTRAYRLYEQAAEGEHAYALYRLALCCDRGVCPAPDGTGEQSAENGQADELPPAAERTVDPAPGDESGDTSGAPQFAYAAQLYERAARRGVADAAYALGLCCRNGRGVRRDGVRAYEWFCAAAERGSIQGAWEAGLCAFEGRDAIQNRVRAVNCFRQAAERWNEKCRHDRRLPQTSGADRCGLGETLPVDGMPAAEAAGRALYMLAYCTLYGIGQTAEALPAGCSAVRAAKSFFEQAVSAGDAAALTALGDLYSFGLLKPDETTGAVPGQARGASEPFDADPAARAAAEPYYLAAVASSASPTGGRYKQNARVRAMVSLADGLTRSIPNRVDGMFTDSAETEDVRNRVWRLLTDANRAGSAEAAVRMAECAGNGWGTAADPVIAGGLLERAERMPERQPKASLWRGLFLQSEAAMSEQAGARLLAADAAYRRAIAAAGTSDDAADCADYPLRERRQMREREDAWAKAEAKYRLAVLLSSVEYEGAVRGDAFPLLVSAVLDGHAAATSDLALMYADELERQAAEDAQLSLRSTRSRRRLAEGAKELARQTVDAVDAARKGRPMSGLRREPLQWMADYYAAYPQEVTLFLHPDASAGSSDRNVTGAMIAQMMNYLGDCLFAGLNLPIDTVAAVSCYRRAAGTLQGRGEPICGGIVWAQYSLGWCLLQGVGVKRDPREAVAWFTRCAKLHPQAAFCLGWCHEHGEGVDAPNDREAIKCYRRAASLGYRAALPRLAAAERRLEKALGERKENG